jgi:hypothetical protein
MLRANAQGSPWLGFDGPSGHGSCPSNEVEGWPEGLEVSPPGSIEGLAGSLHVLVTGPTEPWPREKTHARTLADHALYQALPAVQRRRAENGRRCGAQLEPPILLPGARGYACVESGHGPPRLPTPACRQPSGQHPAARRRGQSRLSTLAQAMRQCSS